MFWLVVTVISMIGFIWGLQKLFEIGEDYDCGCSRCRMRNRRKEKFDGKFDYESDVLCGMYCTEDCNKFDEDYEDCDFCKNCNSCRYNCYID